MDLRVRCDRRPDTQKGETDPRKLYYDSNVYSGMLEWSPVNQQAETFRGEEPRPVVEDVLLTKLRPGQVCNMLRRLRGVADQVDG
jgi:DNA-directed RNA polymerase I and III subunit RPAC1